MRLGEILIERKLITRRTSTARSNCSASAATSWARSWSTGLRRAARRAVRASPNSCRFRSLTIEGPPAVSPEIETLSPRFLRQFRCLPVALHDHTVTLAMADPLDFETRSTVASCTGLTVNPGLARRAGNPRRHRPLLRPDARRTKPSWRRPRRIARISSICATWRARRRSSAW